MAQKNEFEEFLMVLVNKPWWVSIVLGAALFVVVRYRIPLLPIDFHLLEGLSPRSLGYSRGAHSYSYCRLACL